MSISLACHTTRVSNGSRQWCDASRSARSWMGCYPARRNALQSIRRHRGREGAQASEAVDELFQFGFALRIGGVHGTDDFRLAVEAFDKRFGSGRESRERGLDRGEILLLNAQIFAESLDAFQERPREGRQLGLAALIGFALG